MSTHPESQPGIPTFETLAADPEIAPLLEFEPARRKVDRPDGWTPELQRELIARIAATGSPGEACKAMDKNLSGAKHLYRSQGAASFRQAWKAAVALAASRQRAERAAAPALALDVPGTITRRGNSPSPRGGEGRGEGLPGQMLNEHGEWEDEASYRGRVADARDNITRKLLNARRLYLREISGCPGKRTAFEILTDLPVDWEKAERLEAQPDEPWHRPNWREPDMLLTAENGWVDELTTAERNAKKEALQRAIDQFREEAGLPPVNWEDEHQE